MTDRLTSGLVDLGFHVGRRIGRPLVRPDWVSINVTLRCNLECEMCVTCYDAPDEMSADELCGIVDQVADWGVPILNLLGGEPFVRRDLGPVLERAQQRGLIVTLTTNGTLLTPETIELLARLNRVHVNFSLDGLQQSNDAIRGQGVFRKATRALKALREAERAHRDEPGWYDKAINVNTLITRDNLDQLVEMAELARELGASKIQFLNLFDHGEAARKSRLWIRRQDLPALDAAIDRLVAHFREGSTDGGDGGFGPVNSLEDLALVKKYYRGQIKPVDAPCYVGHKELYLNVNGDGLMCDGRLDFTNGSFGNARRQPLREMWTSPAARAMRRRVAACRKACLQDCYLRRESDDLGRILNDVARGAWSRLGIALAARGLG